MGHIIGRGTRPEKTGKGSRKLNSNVKKWSNIEKRFAINIKEYGGTIETAEEQIRQIICDAEGKTKVRSIEFKNVEKTDTYWVKVKFKVKV